MYDRTNEKRIARLILAEASAEQAEDRREAAEMEQEAEAYQSLLYYKDDDPCTNEGTDSEYYNSGVEYY